ncbi:MAG: sulfotransferase [Gammaproteobacteria bacterium]|nr:sulfotransferase [Gammaproteobacteria bacterium]
MNPVLGAALARCTRGNDPSARRELMRLRGGELSPEEYREVARTLTKANSHRAAALWWLSACRRSPDDPRVACRLANALRMAGHARVAERLLGGLCREYPDWADPAHSLAWLYRRRGDAERAAGVMEAWFEAAGSPSGSLFPVGNFLQDMGMAARAEAWFAKFPGDVNARAERGALLAKLGRFDEAEALLTDIVRQKPAVAGAWLRLAATRRWQDESRSPRALMQAVLERPELDDDTRAAIGFALAKVEDDLGHYEQAWRALDLANALRSHSAPFNPAAWGESEQDLYRVFTADYIARLSGHDGQGEAPIFIIGMPRSGTTLLERRLARHSSLTGAGELELVEELGRKTAGRRGYPAGVAGFSAAQCAHLAASWRQRLPAMLAQAETIIDKNPLNFLHVGWIACLFPKARIIHCRRDPLDTVLSLWFQNFAHWKNNYAYRREDIAWMYALYRRMMAHWDNVLPGRIRTVDYERVVADPGTELQALIAWLGLEWEDGVLRDAPSADGGAISTASLWQARQPIYSSSVGRARHYEPWMAGFRDALAAAGIISV